MTGAERRSQVLAIAAREFADHGLHGASIDAIAREAGITQAYVFRMFNTKKALFLELVGAAFDSFTSGMSHAAEGARDIDALTLMGQRYYVSLADRTTLMLQLQGVAACGDPEVRSVVRGHIARMWDTVARSSGLPPVTVKAFLAFGMLLNTTAALDLEEVNEPWANGLRTRIHPALFEHITNATNRRRPSPRRPPVAPRVGRRGS